MNAVNVVPVATIVPNAAGEVGPLSMSPEAEEETTAFWRRTIESSLFYNRRRQVGVFCEFIGEGGQRRDFRPDSSRLRPSHKHDGNVCAITGGATSLA